MSTPPARLSLRARRTFMLPRNLSGYWRDVGTLTSGTAVAQAIGIISMIAIARIYSPEEVGAYAVFFALAGLLALLATAKYDAAVCMARTPREAADIAVLATVLTVIVAAGLLIAAPFAPLFLIGVTDRPVQFLLWLAVACLAGGASTALTAWATQTKAFKATSLARIAQSLTAAIVTILLGLLHFGEIGLIAGFVVGLGVYTALLGLRLNLAVHLGRFTLRAAQVRARRHARFPRFMLVGEGLNYAGTNLIPLISPIFFGTAALGQYSIGQRAAGLPLNVIGTAMGGVFRSAVSPQHLARSEVPALFRTTLIRLAAVGLVLVLPLLVAGPLLFSLVFGARWETAGLYVQILAPMLFMRFVTSSLSVILVLRNRQDLDMMLQGSFLLTAGAAVAIGALTHNFLDMVIALSATHSIVYGFYLWVSYRLAEGMKIG